MLMMTNLWPSNPLSWTMVIVVAVVSASWLFKKIKSFSCKKKTPVQPVQEEDSGDYLYRIGGWPKKH